MLNEQVRTTIQRWAGTHEMMMTGTAAFNPALPASVIVTSDLTGEELLAMTSLGYAPIKLLMSTSIYSLQPLSWPWAFDRELISSY